MRMKWWTACKTTRSSCAGQPSLAQLELQQAEQEMRSPRCVRTRDHTHVQKSGPSIGVRRHVMELVRVRSLGGPAFGCPPAEPPCPPAYQYQPSSAQQGCHDTQESAAEGPSAAAPPGGRGDSLLGPFLQPNPANFAALRCEWTHPAVINLVTAQGLPGISLAAPLSGAAAAAVPAAPPQQPSLWNSMLPALSGTRYPIYPTQQLRLLSAPRQAAGGTQAAQQPGPAALAQPDVCVGHQDDWLELSPAMLPLWHAVPLEPYAGQKPVQFFVLCPEELQSQAVLFVKDVGAQYELCGLGAHHPAPQPPWLYSFSTVLPPECSARGPQCVAWARLSLQQRYLVGLRTAAQRLQRALLTTPLQLRQEGPALEVNLGSAPVVYIVCPFAEGSGQQEAALLEVASCLAPCTPAGASCSSDSDGQGAGGGGSGGAAFKSAGLGGVRLDPGGPATPDPGGDRFAGTSPGDAASPSAMVAAGPAPADAAAVLGGPGEAGAGRGAGWGPPLVERYHGAAECLFQHEQGSWQRMAAREFQQGRVPPLDLTLQLMGPRCLSDLSGQAAKATAFELYLKIRRRPHDPHSLQQGQQQAQRGHRQAASSEGAVAQVPFCSEPLFTLAHSAPCCGCAQPVLQEQGSADMPDVASCPSSSAAAGAQPHRTLHCCYALPPDLSACVAARAGPGGTGVQRKMLLVPAAWTDSCGELLHCEVLEVDLKGSNPGVSPHALACSAVAQRCAALLSYLRLAAQPPDALQHLVISRLGAMHGEECSAWEQLAAAGGGLLVPLDEGGSSQRVAVVALEAAPPARLAAPSGPPGGARLLLQDDSCGRPAGATLVLLPSDGPGALSLPGEHDTVRTLQLTFVGAGGVACAPGGGSSGRGWGREQALSLATELYNLSVLNAAHFHLLWGSCTAPGGLCAAVGGTAGPPPSAHLPFHAHLVERMQCLVGLLCSGGTCSGGH